MALSNRITKLRKVLKTKKLSGILLQVTECGQSLQPNNQNVLYLSGFGGSTAVLLITATKTYIICDARYWSRAALESPEFQLVKLNRGERQTNGINAAFKLAKITKTSSVAFEAAKVTYQTAEIWKKELEAKLVPTLHLVERLRQYKEAAEIAQLKHACAQTDKVYKAIAKFVKAGMTELEVGYEIDMQLRAHGAVDNSFSTIVGSGPNSAIPHHATGDRKLKAGEPVVMDFGGVFPGGYCSDITRTIFVPGKEPTAKMKEVYQIVLAANKAAKAALKPGLMWNEYDKIARDYIDKKGYGKYFTHGLGHSVGLEVHDPFDYGHDALNEGTVITDEPGIYIDGVGGVRIEDDLVVTKDGAIRLTAAPYWKFN